MSIKIFYNRKEAERKKQNQQQRMPRVEIVDEAGDVQEEDESEKYDESLAFSYKTRQMKKNTSRSSDEEKEGNSPTAAPEAPTPPSKASGSSSETRTTAAGTQYARRSNLRT